ncbi:MAG: hypothetical protein ACYDHH_19310 [Solirubrobacteraceae bacterium]
MIALLGARIGDLIPRLKLYGALASLTVGLIFWGVGTTAPVTGAAASATGATGVTGAAPAPINDNYLSSLELNRRGAKLNRVDTLRDVRDTSGATVQTNIFDPCGLSRCPTGPAEVTNCNGVDYGNTIWYDFYPDADGLVSIRTSGFDNVITLYRFNTRSFVPDASHKQCVHQGTFPSEQLVAHVQKGVAYTLQIGGVVGSGGVPAGGPLQMLFDYSVTPPRSLTADATLTARATPTGISIISLGVTAKHRGARIEVNCAKLCRPEALKVPKRGSTTVNFPRLAGLPLPAGARLQIRVSAPHAIGVLIQYDVLTGNFTKQTFCMEPGSRKPRRTCR